MTPERDLQRVEDDRITHVLEPAPAVMVPRDFAARVMAQLPERKVARIRVASGLLVRRTHYGRNAMLAGAMLLCCLLVAAGAVGHGGGTAWQLMEWTAMTQLAGIALWFGLAWRAA
jgi:hypothetical protein